MPARVKVSNLPSAPALTSDVYLLANVSGVTSKLPIALILEEVNSVGAAASLAAIAAYIHDIVAVSCSIGV